MFGQAKASFLVSNPREQRICTIGEAFRVLKSRIFQARGILELIVTYNIYNCTDNNEFCAASKYPISMCHDVEF